MMAEHPLDLNGHRTTLNASVVSEVPGAYDDNLQADIALTILPSPPEYGQFSVTLFGPLIKNAGANDLGYSRQTDDDIFGAVTECRELWKDLVVESRVQTSASNGTKFAFPFKEKWDFSGAPSLPDEVWAQLALAGEKLFGFIFELNCDDDLKEIGGALRLHLKAPRTIAITSPGIFIPWPMLYTHPDGGQLEENGSNWKKEGFWGYRHIVQHIPRAFKPETAIKPDPDGSVALSVNFDDRLALSLQLPSIDAHIETISALGRVPPIRRTKRNELATAFMKGRDSLERIVYFYCHGHGSSSASQSVPHLQMAEGKVSATDFKLWAKDQGLLPTRPLVFINACQGGQMVTLFYKSFANELLQQGAVALIGAQIDVPAVFASAYGELLLKSFFERNKGRVRLGPLMRKVNQEMWDKHNNPLGLVYSLYRGVDCFIDWPAAAATGPAR